MSDDRAALAEVSADQVQQALRTYEQWGGALRYLERQKWHLSDIMAMRKVLEEFAALRDPPAPDRGEAMREKPSPKPGALVWPNGCIKRSSCARHAGCMYAQSTEQCRHFGKDLTAEVRAETQRRESEAGRLALQGGPGDG